MSYLVLARKYRPQTFTDMIGQGHVVRTLTNAIRQGRVAHAFLFTGARGVGKTSGARLLAKSLNCEKGPTAEPCGDCAPCNEITAGTSVDVQEIDGASNNGVDQVRELRENARYLPSRDKNKIYIIDEVHMLSGAAFNALLKTLEEPPAHVKFIFATTEPHKIPVTILSRTQRFDFRRIPLSQIVARIESILDVEGIVMSGRAAALIARQAEGSMRDALSLLDQVISAGGSKIEDEDVEEILGVIDRTEVASLAGALMSGDGALALRIVGRVFDRGLDLARLAEDLAWHLRNLLVMKVGGRAMEVLDVADHERAGLEEQAGQASAATLSFLFDVVHGAIFDIGRAVQPRLVLEVALLKSIHMAPGVDLEALVQRVEALGSVIGAGGTLPPSGHPAKSSPSMASGGLGGAATSGSRASPSASSGSKGEAASLERGSSTGSNTTCGESLPPPSGVFGDYAARMQARAERKAREMGHGEEAAMPGQLEVASAGAAALSAGSGAFSEPAASSVDEPGLSPSSAVAPPANGAESKKAPPPPGRLDGEGEIATSSSKAGAELPASKGARPASASRSNGAGGKKSRSSGEGKIRDDKPSGVKRDQEPSGKEEARLSSGDDPSAPISDRFGALVSAVTQLGRRPFLAAALEHARPLVLTEEELVLALPRGLYYDGLHGAANRRTLEMLIEDHFGAPLQLRLEVADEKSLEGVPESIATIKERRLAEEARSLRAEALENPAVRLAVEALDGEIEAIRILGPQE